MAKTAGKKIFYDVSTPIVSTRIQLFGSSPDEFVGKIIRLDLTRILRGRSLELRMRIEKDGDKLEGKPISLELMGSYIRRMIRKGTDYVEDSFEADCKDSGIIIKLFLITRKKVSRSVRKALRENARKFIETYVKNMKETEIFSEIMTNKIQKELYIKLKKIYPLALCEIRFFGVTGAKKQTDESIDEVKGRKKVEKEIAAG